MSTVQIPDYKTDPFFGLEDKWIETAEGELTHYHEIGEGTPILFLHGSGTGVSAAANWWLNLPAIGEQARCIAIDTIGYGQPYRYQEEVMQILLRSSYVVQQQTDILHPLQQQNRSSLMNHPIRHRALLQLKVRRHHQVRLKWQSFAQQWFDGAVGAYHHVKSYHEQ